MQIKLIKKKKKKKKPQCLKTTFFKREVTLKVSKI